ncbi:MAG: STAS domain-containing protein [Magnetococcales bacterium]|nr:STAS domain-containing protein [Magnetococcales bacterium]
MTNAISVDHGSEATVIVIHGKFSFDMHQQFRATYQGDLYGSTKDKRFVIDLAGVDYIDSSALGMLLLMRKESGDDKTDIRIINARPTVRKILEITNFQKIFEIT